MTKVLFIKKETEDKAKIMTIHHQPNLLSSEKKAEGFEIEGDMPEKPQLNKGERALPYINLKTKKIWYEIVKKELSEEEKRDEKLDRIEQKLDKLFKK